MKRKALALVLTAAMAATALAGCGSSADTGSASTTPAASEDTAKDDTAAADTEEDGDYYVDEDGNKYKKFDDVQLKMLVCWNGGGISAFPARLVRAKADGSRNGGGRCSTWRCGILRAAF